MLQAIMCNGESNNDCKKCSEGECQNGLKTRQSQDGQTCAYQQRYKNHIDFLTLKNQGSYSVLC